MNVLLKNIPAVAIENGKLIPNEKAKSVFKEINLSHKIKEIDLSKNLDFIYIGKELFVATMVKTDKFELILFTQVDENQSIPKVTYKKDDLKIYTRDMFQEFISKFLELKKRYGGFNIKLLVIELELQGSKDEEKEKKILEYIISYIKESVRHSDVVGKIEDNLFSILLTNASANGVDIVIEKINSYISNINKRHPNSHINTFVSIFNEPILLKTQFNQIMLQALQRDPTYTSMAKW